MSTRDTDRRLTPAERDLAASMFGEGIALAMVEIRHRPWWWFQPRNVIMAPRGHIHFHPAGSSYRPCFANTDLAHQALFIHEMTHVWQHQCGLNLLVRRHPFCRYDYIYEPGRPLRRYGIEQQAEIVKHVFLMRRGWQVPGKPPLGELEAILPF
jgi:hypothetical protein